MDKKDIRSLYELTKNSRISTKELSKVLKTSQQLASHIKRKLRKKKLIKLYSPIVDPARFGLTNIVVGYNFLKFDYQSRKEVIDYLMSLNSVVGIQEGSLRVDLVVEFSVKNLSAFNKQNSDLMEKCHDKLSNLFALPVIVKHIFLRKYLARKKDFYDIILCGDRDVYELSKTERSVLINILQRPQESFVGLAKDSGVSTKTIINVKKRLEAKKILKGYTCTPNFSGYGINRYLVFLKISGGGLGKVSQLVEFCKLNKNVVELFKTMGEYQVILSVEELKRSNLVLELRSKFMVDDFLIVHIDNIKQNSFFPKEVI